MLLYLVVNTFHSNFRSSCQSLNNSLTQYSAEVIEAIFPELIGLFFKLLDKIHFYRIEELKETKGKN